MKNLKQLCFLVTILFSFSGHAYVSWKMKQVDVVDVKPMKATGYQGESRVKLLVLYKPSTLSGGLSETQLTLKKDLSRFFNRPFDRSEENRAEYILDLPFHSETSVYQYFKEQSGGKLNVLTSITSDEQSFLEQLGYDEDGDKENDGNDYDLIMLITDSYFLTCNTSAAKDLVEHSSAGLTGITAALGAEGYDYFAGDLNEFSQPYAWTVCCSIARFSLDVPGIHQEDMREKLISYGLMIMPTFSGPEQQRLMDRMLVHPPNMNPYFRWKLGWVQMKPLSHMSMVRIGLMHEGDVIYKYEPNDLKVSDADRDRLGIANYPDHMAGWQNNIDGEGRDQGGHDFLLLENRQDLGYEGGEVEVKATTRGILDPGKVLAGNTVAPAEGIVIYEMSTSKDNADALASQVVNSSDPVEIAGVDGGALHSALSKYFTDLLPTDVQTIVNPVYTSSQLTANYKISLTDRDIAIPNPLPDCLTTYYPVKFTWEYVDHIISSLKKQVSTPGEESTGDTEEKLRFGLIDARGLGGDIGRDKFDFYPHMVDEPGLPQFPWRGDLEGDDAAFDGEHFPFISSRNSDYKGDYDDIEGPVTEFGGYFYYVINSFDYLTSKKGTITKDDISQSVDFSNSDIDYFTPTFSNFSDLSRMMTVEVCSSDFYYNGSHGKAVDENGFIKRRFPNQLGISLKEDRYDREKSLIGYSQYKVGDNVPGMPLTNQQYINWKNKDLTQPTYRSYSIDLNMDYLATQKDLGFGLWNKGGQDLSYTVTWGDDQEDGWFLPLKNPALSGTFVGNQSAVYRARINMDYLKVLAGKMNAVDHPVYTKRIKLATVEWESISEPDQARIPTMGYDVYINIVMKAPAEMNFFGMPKDSEPGSPVKLIAPIYAKGANGKAIIANKRRQSDSLVGKSMLKAYVKSNKQWLSPREVAGEAAEFYVVPNGFSEVPVSIEMTKYLDAREALNSTVKGDAELIATTDTIGVDLPKDSIMRTEVVVQVQDAKPVDPIIQQVSTSDYNIVFSKDVDEDVTVDNFIEVNSASFKIEWNPAKHTRFCFVYSAGESTVDLSDVDWQDISGVVDSGDNCVVDYRPTLVPKELMITDEVLEKFPQFAVDFNKYEHLTKSDVFFKDSVINKQAVFGLRTIAINDQELESRFLGFSRNGIGNFNSSKVKELLMYLVANKASLVQDPNASSDAISSIEILTKIVSNIYTVFDYINPDPDNYTPAQKAALEVAIVNSIEEIQLNDNFIPMETNLGVFDLFDQLDKHWQIAGLSSDIYKRKLFISDDMSEPFGVIRRQIGAPTDLTATSERENYVYLEWSAKKEFFGYVEGEKTYDDIDIADLSVWRSKNTNIEDAVELTKGDIEPRSVTSTLEPIALFKYSDRTALPYPNIYYYWVKRDEGKLDPDYADPDYGLSNMAKGGLGKPNDGWLPIVDFIADDFDVSEGVTVVGKPDDTRSGSTFNPASPEFILDSGNSLDDSGTSIRFSAKISFDVDLEDYAGQEVQLNFDYKFKNLTDRSYLVALVDGKQVYAAKASESSSDWMGSNLIDITAQASGKKVTVVIGLVPDYLLIGAGLGDDQQLHLRNVKVGEKNYGPRWELLSIPSDGSINNILPNSVTSGNNIYSWNYAEADYNMGVSSANLALDPGVGYWILSTTPLTTENKILSSFDTTPNNVLSSKLAQVKTGWNLVGPVKKTFLRSGSAAGNSPVAYLNNYFGTNLVTGTAEEPVLNCQIWFWNPQVKQYQPVQDELNVGDAYWIFKF